MEPGPGHISQEQADEYAIGSLEPEMERLVTLHAADCDLCRDLLFEAQRVASHIAAAAPLVRAPRELKRRVEVSAGLRRPPVRTYVIRAAQAAAGIAAVTIAIIAFAGMISMRGQVNDLQTQNASLQDQILDISSQEVEIFALSQRLTDAERRASQFEASADQDRELLAAMISPDSDFAEVITLRAAGNSVGRLVWDQDQNRLWFVARKLPQLPSGQVYQFWVESGGDWISLGSFNSDETGTATYSRLVPEGLDSYDSAIVTIETVGASVDREGTGVFMVSRLPGSPN